MRKKVTLTYAGKNGSIPLSDICLRTTTSINHRIAQLIGSLLLRIPLDRIRIGHNYTVSG